MSAITSCVIALAAGVALNAAFPDANLWPLAYVAVAGLWLGLSARRAWGALMTGWIFGLGFWLPHVWWAYEAVGAVPWVALSAAEGLAFGLFAAAWVLVRDMELLSQRPMLGPPVFALLWVGVEQLRSLVPFGGFPWGRIAFSQVDAPVAALAWVGGVPLTGFVVVLAGALLGAAVVAWYERRVIAGLAAPLTAVALVLSGLFVPLDTRATEGEMRVGVVQGNVPDLGLDSFSQARQVTSNHRDVTIEMMNSDPGDLDLVLWPENATDYDPRVDSEAATMLDDALAAAGVPILLGTNDYSPAEGRYNSMVLFSPEREVLDTYEKQRPAPFAEYIPLRDIARVFSDAVDLVTTEVVPGRGPATVTLDVADLGREVVLATPICFEVAYDLIVTDAIDAGAQLLLVPTNNATFGQTAESTQQLAMTRLRAIESGRAAIQASTVGVSGIVQPDGRLVQSTELFTPAYMTATVPLRSEITPAVQWRHLWHWGFLIVPAVVAITGITVRIQARYAW